MATSPLPTHYEILGVSQSASLDEIKKAYHKQANLTHSDHGGSDGLFRLLNQARVTLSDPGLRAEYDVKLRGGHDDDQRDEDSNTSRRGRGSRGPERDYKERPEPLRWPTKLNAWPTAFGTPGLAIDSSFSEVATRLGREGEHIVARAIDDAELGPAALVFHGIVPPGGDGDCDHVIVVGDLLIVVDSKRWRRGCYETVVSSRSFERWDPIAQRRITETISQVEAYRDGEPFPAGLLKSTGFIALKLVQSLSWTGRVLVVAALSDPAGGDEPYDISHYSPPYIDQVLTAVQLPAFLSRVASDVGKGPPVISQSQVATRLWRLCRDQESVRSPFPTGWADRVHLANPTHNPKGTPPAYLRWAVPIAVVGAVVDVATALARAFHVAVLPLAAPAFVVAALAIISSWALHDIKAATTSDATIDDLREISTATGSTPPGRRSGPELATATTVLALVGAAWLFVRASRIYNAHSVWDPVGVAIRLLGVLAIAVLAVALTGRRARLGARDADAWEAEWRALLANADKTATASALAGVALAEDRAGTGAAWLLALDRTGHQPARAFHDRVEERRAASQKPRTPEQVKPPSASGRGRAPRTEPGTQPFLPGLIGVYGLLALSSLQAERYLSILYGGAGLDGGTLFVETAIVLLFAVCSHLSYAHGGDADDHRDGFFVAVAVLWLTMALSTWFVGVLACVVATVVSRVIPRVRHGSPVKKPPS